MSAILDRTSTQKRSSDAEEAKLLWPPVVICVILLWLLPMGTSLGLDETGTWWVVKDGLHEAIARAKVWPAGQSIIYDLILIAVRAVAGDSDFALRVPSVLAMGLALHLLYRLGKKLFGPLSAMFSCLVFLTLGDVVYVASTVRPYALGLLFLIASMLALINWLDTGKHRYGAVYSILAALTVHAHYLLGVVLLVHAVYVFARIREDSTTIRLKDVLWAWSATATLVLPLVPFFLSVANNSAQHVFLNTPSLDELLAAAAPPELAGATVLALLFGALASKPLIAAAGPEVRPAWFAAFWAFVPIAAFFLISVFTPLKLFLGRYYLAYAPGMALFAGGLFTLIESRPVRLVLITALTVSAIVRFDVYERAMRGADDWRGAAQEVRAREGRGHVPVLMVSGFIEAQTMKSLDNPLISEVLFAPCLRYDFGSPLIRLPMKFDPASTQYVRGMLMRSVGDGREFFLVGRMFGGYADWLAWLRAESRVLGFVQSYSQVFSGVEVTMFKRATGSLEPGKTIPATSAKPPQTR